MFRESPALGASELAFTTLELDRPASVTAGADSEYGRLVSLLLANPASLSIVPCNSVSNQAIREGRESRRPRAVRQHRQLRAALEAEGVNVRLLSAEQDLPDLCFTRDTSLMTPWGLLGLRPGAAHRTREVDVVMEAALAAGLPWLGRVKQGRVEGGDIAMIRPGLVAIGISGERTDETGAEQVSALFRSHGWEVISYQFDPHFLHLDTIFCMVDSGLALACTDVLEPEFVARLGYLGIALVDVSYRDSRQLGCNLLSLGNKRVITSGTCPSADRNLVERGYRVIEVELDEFIQCGGGVHCLTMPLERAPG